MIYNILVLAALLFSCQLFFYWLKRRAKKRDEQKKNLVKTVFLGIESKAKRSGWNSSQKLSEACARYSTEFERAFGKEPTQREIEEAELLLGKIAFKIFVKKGTVDVSEKMPADVPDSAFRGKRK